jgi:hypothetical protein
MLLKKVKRVMTVPAWKSPRSLLRRTYKNYLQTGNGSGRRILSTTFLVQLSYAVGLRESTTTSHRQMTIQNSLPLFPAQAVLARMDLELTICTRLKAPLAALWAYRPRLEV